MRMDIYLEMKKLTWKKQMYFKWKHDLEYDQSKPKKSEDDLKRILKVQSLNEYVKWEKSEEYLRLVNLVLQTNFANDLNEIYKTTAEKAKSGDEKAIKMLLDLQKSITQFNKTNAKAAPTENYDPYADLEL